MYCIKNTFLVETWTGFRNATWLCRCFEVFHPSPVSSKCEFPFHYVPFRSLHCSVSLWLCSALLSRNASLCSRLWSTEHWPFTSLFFWSFHTLLPLYQNRDLSLNSSMESLLLCLFSFIYCNFPNRKDTSILLAKLRLQKAFCRAYYQWAIKVTVYYKKMETLSWFNHLHLISKPV